MEQGELDLEDKNIVGGLDRLVIWIGLAVLAVLPTLFIVTFLPWRAAPLIAGERPSGRDGYVLGPGIFFVTAIVSTFVLISMLDIPERASPAPAAEITADIPADPATTSPFQAGFKMGAQMGDEDGDAAEEDSPGIGTRILTGIQSGNIWQAASSISPFFFAACFIAGITAAWGSVLRIPQWTLRAAMGGALYFATTYTVWFSLPIAIMKYLFGDIPSSELSSTAVIFLVLGFIVPLLALPWQTFWFVKAYTGTSAHKAGLATAGSIGTLVSVLIIVITVSTINAFTDAEAQNPEASSPAPVATPSSPKASPIEASPGLTEQDDGDPSQTPSDD